jgi:hypothetical protein
MSNVSEQFLAGGGPASVKFPAIGTVVGGKIIEEPEVQQQRDIETGVLLTWQDGNPRMQMVVTLQTSERDPEIEDDDGIRRLFVKANLRKAVQEAVIAASCKGLDVGGTLEVAYIGDGEKTNRAYNAPKLYKARYTPPVSDGGSSFLGTAPKAAAGDPFAPQPAAPAPAASPLDGLSPEAAAAIQAIMAGAKS